MRTSRISRDELVERGINAAAAGMETHNPWIYSYKIKSGTRRTQSLEGQFANIQHLYADAIRRHARHNEAFSIYGIQRVMRAQLRSMEEDI
jgi:hypothetical protein